MRILLTALLIVTPALFAMSAFPPADTLGGVFFQVMNVVVWFSAGYSVRHIWE